MAGLELALLCFALLVVAALYASVGHGGASGYLAVLSLTTYATMEVAWLKQHAWVLNLLVAALAFHHYKKAGFFDFKFTLPFILASVPMAMLGGSLRVDGALYDTLLSLTLIWAAWRLLRTPAAQEECREVSQPLALGVGAGIGLVSGIIGVGGGIFLSPILLLNRWATPKSAAATSACFIWLNSLAGLGGAALSDQLALSWETLLPFLAAVGIGGFLGARHGAQIAPQSAVRKLLVAVLVIAAAKRTLELLV